MASASSLVPTRNGSSDAGELTTFVSRIVVEPLFGNPRYSYDLKPDGNITSLSKLLILYGENGTGKTTLLWLLYHLLQHRIDKSYIAKVRFKRFAVFLGDSMEIAVERKQSAEGSFTMSVSEPGRKKEEQSVAVDEFGRLLPMSEKDSLAFANFLKRIPDLQLVFLPDTRRTVPIPDPEEEEGEERLILRESGHVERIIRRRVGSMHGEVRPGADPVLERALRRVSRWISNQALAGSTEGQLNVNAVYSDIVARVATARATRRGDVQTADQLIATLVSQAQQTKEFSQFGFTSDFKVEPLIASIEKSRASKNRLSIIEQILRPYIEGNAARLNALTQIQQVVKTFVGSINAFLVDKKLVFHTSLGIRIITDDGMRLSPRLLSSGEKELLLLFCNVLISRSAATVFIIDEPELSLNVIWQRMLIDSLLRLVSHSRVQFLLATHSIELLAQHRSNVLRLTASANEERHV